VTFIDVDVNDETADKSNVLYDIVNGIMCLHPSTA